MNFTLLILILENIRRNIQFTIPFGPLIALAFLIENSLTPSILNAFYSPEFYNLGDSYFLDYPISKYFPFAITSTFIYYIALRTTKKTSIIALPEYIYEIKSYNILFIYLIGFTIQLLNISSLNFISQITYFVSIIYIITFNHPSNTIKFSIRTIGLLFLFAESNTSGMFGSLISGLIVFGIYSLHNIYRQRSKNPLALQFYTFVFLGFLLLSFSQQYKILTRSEIWEDSHIENNTSERTSTILSEGSLWEKDFHRPAVSRLNQGWLVSLAMKKTEKTGIFLMGETILQALKTAIIPRIIWLNKPKAGGAENIKKFTDLILNSKTSMNIGTLGELFVNFGFFSVVLIFFWGKLIIATLGYLSRNIKQNKLYFYLLPFVFLGFLPSGNDIAMQLTHAVKSTIFIATLNRFLL